MLLSSKRCSSRILISTWMCPSSTASFRMIESHTRALFQNALHANPQLACLSGMDAGISTTGLPVTGVPGGPLAMMIGCSSVCIRRHLQSRSTWVALTLYLTVSFALLPKHLSCFSWAQYSNTPHIQHLCRHRCHDFGGTLPKR